MLSSKTGPFKKSGKLQREKINQKNESNDCEDFTEEQQTEDFTKQPTRNFPEERKGDLVKFCKEELTKCTKEGYKENLAHFTNELAEKEIFLSNKFKMLPTNCLEISWNFLLKNRTEVLLKM